MAEPKDIENPIAESDFRHQLQKTKTMKNLPTPTEKEYISSFIDQAMELATKNHNGGDVLKLKAELYDNLFAWRDNKKKSLLEDQSNHALNEIFAELKFGRPAPSQRYLDDCINQLKEMGDAINIEK